MNIHSNTRPITSPTIPPRLLARYAAISMILLAIALVASTALISASGGPSHSASGNAPGFLWGPSAQNNNATSTPAISDSDGDGVPDATDACPDEGDAGSGINQNGCPQNPPVADFGTVIVGTNAEYPPFEFVDESGTITGFDIAVMATIAAQARIEIEYVNTRWDGIFPALASGEFDVVISAATITPEREEIIDFADPYYYIALRIAVRAGDEVSISDVADLAGLRVGVESDTPSDYFASDRAPSAEIVRYDEVALAVEALAAGDVDAVISPQTDLFGLLADDPSLGVTLTGPAFNEEFYAIATEPGRSDLLMAINAAQAAIIADGTYRDIYIEWFGVEPDAMFMPADAVIEPAVEEPATEAPTPTPVAADFDTVIVGTNAEYPPFEQVDEDGNIVGFDVDVMDAIAAQAGIEIEYANTRWDGIFIALASGEFDVVISAATITPEREEIIDFADPYFYIAQRIAVRAGDEDSISDVADLAGLRVGVESDTPSDYFASEVVSGAEVLRYDELTLAMQALVVGDVDAVISTNTVLVDLIATNPSLDAVLTGPALSEEYYAIATEPGRADLLDAINTAQAAIIADGTYRDIYVEWFGVEPDAMFIPAE